MHITAIVVAAGRGVRMQTATAKAFLDLGGVPMVVHSLRTLSRLEQLRAVVLVVPRGAQRQANAMLERLGPWPIPIHPTAGGAERQDSVAAGLALIEATTDLVLIHDAARPFVSLTCAQACVAAAAAGGAAIAAVPAQDTVKYVNASAEVTETLDRQRIWLAQTPQVFRTQLLRDAYARAQHDGFVGTDDAALVERLGSPVRIVPGETANRKLTTPEDLRWAEWYLHTARLRGASGSRHP